MALVRVSVANLAWFARYNNTDVAIAIRSKEYYKTGKTIWQALGGAAMLTEYGRSQAEMRCGATDFEFDTKFGCYDARFVTDESRLADVERLFRTCNPRCELPPETDIIHELCENIRPSWSDILRTEAKVRYRLTTWQGVQEKGHDASKRARTDMETRRLFRIFCLDLPEVMCEMFLTDPRACILTDLERATTNGGCTKGNRTNGEEIKNNIFIPESR
jgi:hypothetical protein